MKVSVVIPVYNAGPFLEKCLRSALDQTHGDIEIIAIDDGSTDTSGAILDGYEDRVRVFHKENGGTATALNYGYAKMDGDWFKWLSADDMLKPDAVEALAKEAGRLGRHARNCIFYTDYDFIDGDGLPVRGPEHHVADNYNHLSQFKRSVILLDHFYGHGSTSLLHRSMFENCGLFDEKIGFNEDYEYWLRCCAVYGRDMHYVGASTASSRIHDAQLSALHAEDGARKEHQIREHVLNMLDRRRRLRYRTALAIHQRDALLTQNRRRVQNAVLGMLPRSASDRLVHEYLNAKKQIRDHGR